MENSYMSLLITSESDEKMERIMEKIKNLLLNDPDIVDFEWKDI